MACASSSRAAVTISSTLRLWPRWITSQPCPMSSRRTILMLASCPSNRLAAVTKRSLAVPVVDGMTDDSASCAFSIYLTVQHGPSRPVTVKWANLFLVRPRATNAHQFPDAARLGKPMSCSECPCYWSSFRTVGSYQRTRLVCRIDPEPGLSRTTPTKRIIPRQCSGCQRIDKRPACSTRIPRPVPSGIAQPHSQESSVTATGGSHAAAAPLAATAFVRHPVWPKNSSAFCLTFR